MTECRRFRALSLEKGTSEEDGAEDEDLEGALSDDVLPHVGSNQALEARIRFAFEKVITGRLSCEGERGQGVHDQIDPKHLNWRER